MKKLLLTLASVGIIGALALGAGCKPNVPENSNVEGDSIVTLPNNNNNANDRAVDRTEDRTEDRAMDRTADRTESGTNTPTDRMDEDRNPGDVGTGNAGTGTGARTGDPFENEEDRETGDDNTLESDIEDHEDRQAGEGLPSTADFNAENSPEDFSEVTSERYQSELSARVLSYDEKFGELKFGELSNALIGWGVGKATDEVNRPLDAINANEKYGNYDALFIGENNNRIYLTFDEGYENGLTEAILDTLKSRGVKATFFVTYDYCKSSPELVKRMIRDGHEVGNHSYSHPSFPSCSEAKVREEIGKLHDYVLENFDYEMKLIRFPKGEFSERVLAIAQDAGYKSVFWSFAYADWDPEKQPETLAALNKIKASAHNGEIVLLHAVSRTNADLLGELIDFWHKEGYKLGMIG